MRRDIVNEPGDPSSCSGVLGASASKTQLGQDLCHSPRRCFGGDPPPVGETALRGSRSPALHPLTSSPPPAGRPPPGREPLGRLSNLGCRRVTGAGGGGRDAAARARAVEGDPRSSSSSSSGGGGRSPGKSPLSRRRRRRSERRRKRRERRRGRKPPWCPCSRCRGGRSSPRLSVSDL
ncbi:CLK4-associating serine/arginine rich protein-like [Eptesicus fuscus]|uniref:CLK4-associating serine/arginine rich protein-like n=1 Tax=Eptesicus fuscus TaxID=29078 RepID=UPI002403D5A4|nr:CLK4-associating serine/arginine rich protein-like [Eptesicus fuscus]